MRSFYLVSSIALACVAQQSYGQFPDNPSLNAFAGRGYGAGGRFNTQRTVSRANSVFDNQKSFNFRPAQQTVRSQQGFVSDRPVQIGAPARGVARSAYIPVRGRGFAERYTTNVQQPAQFEVQQQVEQPQFEVQQVQQVEQPQFEIQQEVQRPQIQVQQQVQQPQFEIQQPRFEIRRQVQGRQVQIHQQPQLQIQQQIPQPQFQVQQRQVNDVYEINANEIQAEQPQQYQTQQVQYRAQRLQYQPVQQIHRVQRAQLQAPLIQQRAQLVQSAGQQIQQVQTNAGSQGEVHEIHTGSGPRNIHVEEIRTGDQVIRVHDSAPRQPIVHNIQSQDDPVLVRLVSKSEGPARIERVVHQQEGSEVYDIVNPASPAEQVVQIDRAPASAPQVIREEVVEQQQPVHVQQRVHRVVQQGVQQVVQAPAVATHYAVATPTIARSIGTGARTVSLVGSGLAGRQYQVASPVQIVSRTSQYAAPIGATQFTNGGSTFGTTVVLSKKKSS